MSSGSKRRRPHRAGTGRGGSGGPGGGQSARNARLRAEAAAREARRRGRRRWVVLGVLAVALLVVGAGVLVGPRLGGGGAAPEELQVSDTVAVDARTPQPVVDGEPVSFGPAGAERVLTIWADFSCSHCADFARDYHDVLSSARQAGQVRVELMPVTFVAPPSSTAAGNAFVCATEAGFGEAYHDALFASFSTGWEQEPLLRLAELVAPNPGSSFTSCLTDGAGEPYLDSVDAAARQAQVDATPTVLLDGVVLDLETTTPAVLAQQLQEQP